jgi:ECF sigma factor
MADVNVIIDGIKSGEPHVPAQRMLFVYYELRELAAHRLAQEPRDKALQPAALVHEESSTGGPAS